MRAIGYFRETKRQSLADQSEAFLEFCRLNGYEAAATFFDSKAEGDRPGFRQMMEFVRQQAPHGFLMVVVPDLSSLSAALTEAARRYFQLASLGVPIVSIDTGEDISSYLLNAWTKYRANGNLGDRVKAAMRRKAVKGEALGRPPYGYRVGPNRRLVIVAEEGSIVRYIFRLYLKDDLGIRRIARRLNEESLRTRRDGLWSMVTVRDILRNRAYVGTYSRFGVRVPASHAPLISQEDFQRVQERLDQRRPAAQTRQLTPFLLSGITYCGDCGNKMIGVTRRQKWQRRGDGVMRTAQYRYYQCESRTNRSLCDYHTRRAEELEQSVREALDARTLTAAAAAAQGNGAASARDAEAQIRRLRDKARRLDRRLEQYLDSAASGSMNLEKVRALSVGLAGEQLQIEDKLAESQRQAEQRASETERRRQWEKALGRLRGEWEALPFGDKQDLLRELLDRIVVADDSLQLIPRP
ncbi:MAG: recombinase family protein [Dehalococcoidia bacterium]|nr:recombinase family protein [Dehalococcoidia bacterium]